MSTPISQHSSIFSKSLVVIATLASLLFVSACSDVRSEQVETSFLHFANIITINPQSSYILSREYVGLITTKQRTELGFEYAGKITKVFVDSGDMIKQYQVLAQQDTELLSIKATELQANIKQINAQLSLNQANLKRGSVLIEKGYTSAQSLDELIAQQQVLQGQLQALKANLGTVRYQISKSRLVAPFDSIVGKRFLSQGEVIAQGQPAFNLIEQDNNEISLGVPAQLAASLTLAQTFSVTIAGQQHTARLIAIGKQINSVNRTVNLRLVLVKSANLFNGQLVRVKISQTRQQQGFWLPLTALTDGIRGQWSVYLASVDHPQNYQIKTRNVNLLHSTHDAAFVSGLPDKQLEIIAQGLHRFVPGQRVKKTQQQLVTHSDSNTDSNTDSNNQDKSL